MVRGWAETDDAEPSYVWVTMRRLRQKLEADPEPSAPPADRPRHRLPAGRHPGRRRRRIRCREPRRPRPMTRPAEPSRHARWQALVPDAADADAAGRLARPARRLRRAAHRRPARSIPTSGRASCCSCSPSPSSSGSWAAAAVGLDLVRPLREISAAVSRVSAGDMSQPIPVVGTDVLAQLAESHNRLAADAERRNRQLGLDPGGGRIGRAARRRRRDGRTRRPRRRGGIRVHRGRRPLRRPGLVEPEERIPGVSVPIRAELRAGDERIGLILASLPATRDLGARRPDAPRPVRQRDRRRHPERRAVRPGPGPEPPAPPPERGQGRLPARRQPQPPDAADVDPGERRRPRRRPITTRACRIISEQADRLSRMVQQLLLVGRLESQPPRTTADVLAIAPRIQRAWDALAVSGPVADAPRRGSGLARRRRRRPARPGALGAPRQRRQVRRGHGRRRGRGRPRDSDDLWRRSPTRATGSRSRTGPGCSGGSSAAPPAGPAATAAGWGCTCREPSCAGWAATSSSTRSSRGAGRPSG